MLLKNARISSQKHLFRYLIFHCSCVAPLYEPLLNVMLIWEKGGCRTLKNLDDEIKLSCLSPQLCVLEGRLCHIAGIFTQHHLDYNTVSGSLAFPHLYPSLHTICCCLTNSLCMLFVS